jgi:hypothetical protein
VRQAAATFPSTAQAFAGAPLANMGGVPLAMPIAPAFGQMVARVVPEPALGDIDATGQGALPQGAAVQEPLAVVASPAAAPFAGVAQQAQQAQPQAVAAAPAVPQGNLTAMAALPEAMTAGSGAAMGGGNDVAQWPAPGPMANGAGVAMGGGTNVAAWQSPSRVPNAMGMGTNGANDVAQWPAVGPMGSGMGSAMGGGNSVARWPSSMANGAAAAVGTMPAMAASPDMVANADPLAAWGPPPAPLTDPRRFTEAHWQGLELVPKTPTLARALKLPAEVPGVVVDDVTLPADLQGFQAGDLITNVARVPTPHLVAFIRATEQIRDEQQTRVDLVRAGEAQTLMLTALLTRLGTANGDSPPMIPPGARMPHPYRGPCTNCHRIGMTGTLAADQGDTIIKTAPIIRVGARRPHEDRGPCSTCHQILP